MNKTTESAENVRSKFPAAPRSAPLKRVLRNVAIRLRTLLRTVSVKRRSYTSPIHLIVGAGSDYRPGWINTNIDTLNILKDGDWRFYFSPNGVDVILAEHVWEHLSLTDGKKAAELCFKYLKPGGYLRLAVPDGYHPSPAYIEYVRPGGIGLGADDHKELYTYKTLSSVLSSIGYQIRLLEYFDENGQFHEQPWQQEDGKIDRCKTDERNKDGKLNYTSLILDAVKP